MPCCPVHSGPDLSGCAQLKLPNHRGTRPPTCREAKGSPFRGKLFSASSGHTAAIRDWSAETGDCNLQLAHATASSQPQPPTKPLAADEPRPLPAAPRRLRAAVLSHRIRFQVLSPRSRFVLREICCWALSP
jgi:hypothetical protein